MKESSIANVFKVFSLLCGLAILVYECSVHFSLGFWYDETFTMLRFVNPGLGTLFTDYEPNNHLLFSLLTWCYTTLLGLNEAEAFVNNPISMRIFTAILGSTSIAAFAWYAWAAKSESPARLTENRLLNWMAFLILVTTIPLWSFFFQLRGYGLSIGFMSWILVLVLRAIEDGQISILRTCFLGVLVTAYFYTIPSNFYFMASLAAPICLLGLQDFLKDRKDIYVKISMAIVVGMGVGFCLYLSVLSQLMTNDYAKSNGYFRSVFDVERFARFFGWLFYGRIWLLALALVGLAIKLWNLRSNKELDEPKFRRRETIKVTVLCSVAFLPFVLVGIHGTKPFDRNYLPAIPAVTFLLAIGIQQLMTGIVWILKIDKKYLAQAAIAILFGLATAASFLNAESQRVSILNSDLETGGRSQNIFANFYQYRFDPAKVVDRVLPELESDEGPYVSQYCDVESLRYYFLAEGIVIRYEADHSPRSGIYISGQKVKLLRGENQLLDLKRTKLEELSDGQRNFHTVFRIMSE